MGSNISTSCFWLYFLFLFNANHVPNGLFYCRKTDGMDRRLIWLFIFLFKFYFTRRNIARIVSEWYFGWTCRNLGFYSTNCFIILIYRTARGVWIYGTSSVFIGQMDASFWFKRKKCCPINFECCMCYTRRDGGTNHYQLERANDNHISCSTYFL